MPLGLGVHEGRPYTLVQNDDAVNRVRHDHERLLRSLSLHIEGARQVRSGHGFVWVDL